jgi:hypothetical protein
MESELIESEMRGDGDGDGDRDGLVMGLGRGLKGSASSTGESGAGSSAGSSGETHLQPGAHKSTISWTTARNEKAAGMTLPRPSSITQDRPGSPRRPRGPGFAF